MVDSVTVKARHFSMVLRIENSSKLKNRNTMKTMKTILITIVIVLFIFLLIYTIYQPPVAGTVIDKKIIEAHNQTSFILVNNNMIPTTLHVPETYSLTVQNNNKQFTFNVKKEVYNNIKIGDYYR